MSAIHNYESFIAAILIFQMIPGPGTLAILNATARNGVGAGLGAVVGTLAGDFVYMLATVLGLAALLAAYPALLHAGQWLGAAYLAWLGWQLLRAPVQVGEATEAPRQTGWRFCRQAFAVSLTNPKVAMFFLAFFPLFLRADSPSATLALMMLHVTLISLAWQAALVFLGNAIARRLARWHGARRLATRLAGIALIGFGAKLAFDNR
jgi:threonine/homoserine/homoserine lactone efflux protein